MKIKTRVVDKRKLSRDELTCEEHMRTMTKVRKKALNYIPTVSEVLLCFKADKDKYEVGALISINEEIDSKASKLACVIHSLF